MEYVRFREFNGVGVNYDTSYYRAEDKKTVLRIRDKKQAYHDSMPGNGYTETKFMTAEYEHHQVILKVMLEKLNKEIQPTYNREDEMVPTQIQNNYRIRKKPITKEQKETEKESRIKFESFQGIPYQCTNRIELIIEPDGTPRYNKSGRIPWPNEIQKVGNATEIIVTKLRDMDSWPMLPSE